MAVVALIEYQIKVVDEAIFGKFCDRILSTGNDLAEIPELPGVCWHDITVILSRLESLDSAELQELSNRILVATKGKIPQAIVFVRKDDPVTIGKIQ